MNKRLMKKNTIIFVTGGPGTGKSYASNYLSAHIEGLTVLSYDHIKERIWDIYGFDSKEQKEKLNNLSLEEYYLALEKLMQKNNTILTEYPFYQRHKDRLQQLVKSYDYNAITILLYGDWKRIYERGLKRDSCTGRHPGHLTNCYHLQTFQDKCTIVKVNTISYEEFCRVVDSKDYDIKIGKSIKIDVTDLSCIDYDLIVKQIYEIDQQEEEK